jgi:hypothetical protein
MKNNNKFDQNIVNKHDNNEKFYNDELLYEIIKENQKQEYSQPKKSENIDIKENTENTEKIEEVKSNESSSYELYEGLDNINSFQKEKEKSLKEIFLQIIFFQALLSILTKVLLKIILFVLENNLISNKFLGKFRSKFQKLLMKLMLAIQLKIILLNFLILHLKSKFLEMSKSMSFKDNSLKEKNEDILKNKYTNSKDLDIKKVLFKNELYDKSNNNLIREFNFSSSNLIINNEYSIKQQINNNIAINKDQIEIIRINSIQNSNLNKMTHGGADYLFFKITMNSNIGKDSSIDAASFLIKKIIQFAKDTINFVKDSIKFMHATERQINNNNFNFAKYNNIEKVADQNSQKENNQNKDRPHIDLNEITEASPHFVQQNNIINFK